MRAKLCRRLEELEKISAEAAARRAGPDSDYEKAIANLMAKADAWHANPENQKWLAQQPPDHLRRGLQALRAQLDEIACGRSRPAQAGGL